MESAAEQISDSPACGNESEDLGSRHAGKTDGAGSTGDPPALFADR